MPATTRNVIIDASVVCGLTRVGETDVLLPDRHGLTAAAIPSPTADVPLADLPALQASSLVPCSPSEADAGKAAQSRVMKGLPLRWCARPLLNRTTGCR